MDGKMKIALLGHTGFVGQNIAETLSENDLEFVGASRKTGIDLRNVNQCVDFFAANKPTHIINCAAHVGSLNYVTERASDVILDNCRMLLSIYEAIAKACPTTITVNPIANCAYPAKADTFIEDHWWDGHLHRSVLSYGASKRLSWAIAESFNMQHEIKSIHLLVPNMYGPFDSTNPDKAHALNALISKFVKAQLSASNEVEIWGTGIAIREWLFAKDFGKIVVQIIKSPAMLGLSEPINIAQNFGLSVRELSEIISRALSYKGKISWNTRMPDGAPKKIMDDRKFRKVFPEFNFASLNDGIMETVKYYKSIFPY